MTETIMDIQKPPPVLEMRLRGVAIDRARKAEVINEYAELMDRLEQQLERQFDWLCVVLSIS